MPEAPKCEICDETLDPWFVRTANAFDERLAGLLAKRQNTSSLSVAESSVNAEDSIEHIVQCDAIQDLFPSSMKAIGQRESPLAISSFMGWMGVII